ncbi:MAG: GNAT family N-acetyltransferase [Aestuariivirgaceae bacterium]
MIKLRAMTEADRDAVLRLQVSPEQGAFVDPLVETLATTALRNDNYVMEAAGEIVGYFQIDSSSGKQTMADNLELHEVLIDVAHQGKGYGKLFIQQLRAFLTETYPDWSSVCLTVNCRNTHAYRLYAFGGFIDTGDLYLEGRSGPQHIMVLPLR